MQRPTQTLFCFEKVKSSILNPHLVFSFEFETIFNDLFYSSSRLAPRPPRRALRRTADCTANSNESLLRRTACAATCPGATTSATPQQDSTRSTADNRDVDELRRLERHCHAARSLMLAAPVGHRAGRPPLPAASACRITRPRPSRSVFQLDSRPRSSSALRLSTLAHCRLVITAIANHSGRHHLLETWRQHQPTANTRRRHCH
jgi:hypothetical protein